MAERFRITIAQANPTVGDLSGNADKAFAAWQAGRDAGAGFVAMPEMFVTGYQTQDLVMKPAFVEDARNTIEALATRITDGPALGIGGPLFEAGRLYNAYYVLQDGKVQGIARKHELPNYGVFDEERLYSSGPISGPFAIGPIRIGTPICEDAWHPDVSETMVESGAEVLLIPNGSPYRRHKLDDRMSHMVSRVVENDVPLIYLNMVGGQDDQVFDGGSFALNRGGALAMMLPVFEEALAHVDLTQGPEGWVIEPGQKAVHPGPIEQDYRLMVEAVRDYFAKTGFSKALLGLSGGVDSAIVAAIASDALGPKNVRCVMLPSRYTSDHSLEDAGEAARLLGCRLDTIPIRGAVDAVGEALAPLFEGTTPDIAEENIQSRLRGVMLMALSNKFGEMLLTTGNKSEVAVGYSTIYGDMAGGYNPVKDLYKTRVFETCRWRNQNHRDWMKGPEGTVVPERIITKPPSAELREDQKDEDSLPPYEVLDVILEMLIDGDCSVAECVEAGFDRETVKHIEKLIYISEYKRFQSAPGPRLTGRSFWLDRRYPIANRWRDNS
ncbi:NAD+ synthase [Oceanibium sediminis]|uniref:NAD+ synthase n=1 Tax=Oceanibium sediminis TaxID=2026339 RepID=UPI000DD34279|nr:NAD+ synthase [Oceanibium sediminis]